METGETPHAITSSNPLRDFVLSVLTILGSVELEALALKGNVLARGHSKSSIDL